MTKPELRAYAENSPEAVLRIITLFIISDGEVQDRELEMLDRLGVLASLGVDQECFASVIDAYCDDLIAHAGTALGVALADPDWVDKVLAGVTDPSRRRWVASMLLLVARSDGYFADAELAVYRRMLDRWELDIDDLATDD